MPKPKRILKKEPNPIFRKKAYRGENPLKIKKWIQWHRRIVRGLLTEEEKTIILNKVVPKDKDIIVHFTDPHFLDSIFKHGLKSTEGIMASRAHPDRWYFFLDILTKARNRYGNWLRRDQIVSEEGLLNTLSRGNVRDYILGLAKNAKPASDLLSLIKEDLANRDVFKMAFDTITKGLTDYADPVKVLENLKLMSLKYGTEVLKTHFHGDESQFFLRCYREYLKGNEAFLKNKDVRERFNELIARVVAREAYYTFSNSEAERSSMSVGIYYPTERSNKGRAYVNFNPDAIKPIGLYIYNHYSLKEVLGKMLRNAKSMADVVPIYGQNSDILWPK